MKISTTETYVAPCVETLDVNVEQGFAVTSGVKAESFTFEEDNDW